MGSCGKILSIALLPAVNQMYEKVLTNYKRRKSTQFLTELKANYVVHLYNRSVSPWEKKFGYYTIKLNKIQDLNHISRFREHFSFVASVV